MQIVRSIEYGSVACGGAGAEALFRFPERRRCRVERVNGASETCSTQDQRERTAISSAQLDGVPGTRAFQFAIRIDSIRYANRYESIRLVKKSAFRFTSCHAVFSCLFIV